MDIKPLNILYNSWLERGEPEYTFKLTDFGFAVRFQPNNDLISEKVGTPGYMAPELRDKSIQKYE